MAIVADLLALTKPSVKRTFENFVKVFGFNIEDYYRGNILGFNHQQEIDNILLEYFKKNKAFLEAFYKDWHSIRTIAGIAEAHNFEYEAVLELFTSKKIFANYNYLPRLLREGTVIYVSTYQVIELLTGVQVIERPPLINKSLDISLYPEELFITDPFAEPDVMVEVNTKPLVIVEPKIIIVGYDDIRSYITEQLDGIANPAEMEVWGLENPGGILLYGPPGCGKTLWANWIAEHLGYEFIEVPRSMFGSTFVDGAMNNLKALLDGLKKKKNAVVFFDEFDSVAPLRSVGISSSGAENSKVVNTLLQEIPKLIERKIVVVAATNFIQSLDPAVIRPGRFDLKLPIFPPLPEERISLLHRAILHSKSSNLLHERSPIDEIMQFNKLTDIKHWSKYTEMLKLFSNSQILDAAKIIKKKLRQLYMINGKSSRFSLADDFVETCIQEAQAQITAQDILTLKKFLLECKSVQMGTFAKRIMALEAELEPKIEEPKRNPIGFNRKN